jgi:hypothetical protein
MIAKSQMLRLQHRPDGRKNKAANRGTLDGFKNPRINVMTFQALECPIFKAFIGRRHAH